MSARRTGVLAVTIVVALLAVSGCGSAGLTPAQVRARATRICDATADRTARIRLPADPSGGPRFLEQGIAALTPEVRALRALGDRGTLRTAVTAVTGELTALRSSRKGLRGRQRPGRGHQDAGAAADRP